MNSALNTSKVREGLQYLLDCKTCLMCKHYLRPCTVSFYNKNNNLSSNVKSDVAICNKLGAMEPFDKSGFYFSKSVNPKSFSACRGDNFEEGGDNYRYLKELKRSTS